MDVDDAERREVDHGLRNDLPVADDDHHIGRQFRADAPWLPGGGCVPADRPECRSRSAATFTGDGTSCLPAALAAGPAA